MKRYYTLYYLLFMTLITGSFASMAQNNYGIKMIGLTFLGFACLFFFEALFDRKRTLDLPVFNRTLFLIELLSLGTISLLFFFRSFFITINGATQILTLMTFALIVVYVIYLFQSILKWWSDSKSLSAGLILYFLISILFLTAGVLAFTFHIGSNYLGVSGFLCLAAFVIWAVIHPKISIHGERTSIFRQIWKLRNKSILVLASSVLVASFFALNQSNLIPPLYTSEKPAGYIHLVRQAEEGTLSKNEPAYELFDERYKNFIDKYGR